MIFLSFGISHIYYLFMILSSNSVQMFDAVPYNVYLTTIAISSNITDISNGADNKGVENEYSRTHSIRVYSACNTGGC